MPRRMFVGSKATRDAPQDVPKGVLGSARVHVASFPGNGADFFGTADKAGFHVYRVNHGEIGEHSDLAAPMGKLPKQFGTQDQANEADWQQIMLRIQRIEQALVMLAGGAEQGNDDPNGEGEEQNALFAGDRARGTNDRALRRPPAHVWRALDAATNRDINAINNRNKRHYKVN